ncbi:helix-turn-helix transcriptional regulator [Streptomyces sp. NPDC046203]|uniref:helix-turn-helix transcriptional regulator n=1 Tax=Streptomyces sp. NPDC046203 TaxID=3154602 RepID=UPI0033F72028
MSPARDPPYRYGVVAMRAGEASPALGFLGVAEPEEQLYRALLRDREDVDGHDPDVLARVLELGIVVRTPAGGLRPLSPKRTVERLIERQVGEFQDDLQETALHTGVVEQLSAASESPGSPDQGDPAVRQIEGLEAVRSAIDEVTFFARTENLTTNPVGVLTPESIEISRPIDLRILRRGVRMRTLMASACLQDETTLAYLRELVARGAEIRISPHPIERMIICDRAVALTPIDPHNTARGALLTREPGLVSTVVSLFERMWAASQDLPEETLPSLTEIERQILRTLYRVDKDETGARQLNMALRTYRKYVARLLTRLDADNRFQAALRARERGWI